MKYGKEIIEELGKHLASGLGRVDTCELVGISYETFTVWMKKPEFSEAIKRAEATCKHRNIVRIQNASRKSWQAAAWWLERKFPEEFALKYRLEHTGKGGGPIRGSASVHGSINMSPLDEATLRKLAFGLGPADAKK